MKLHDTCIKIRTCNDLISSLKGRDKSRSCSISTWRSVAVATIILINLIINRSNYFCLSVRREGRTTDSKYVDRIIFLISQNFIFANQLLPNRAPSK